MYKSITTVLAVSLGIAASFHGTSSARGATLNLGPEEIVQAGGSDLTMPGLSVPLYTDWNNDGLNDLIVGEGGWGYPGMVRVYLNEGTVAAPQFSSTPSYAISGVGTLVVPAGGCLGAFPRLVYWDDDDKKDLLVGLSDGTVKVYLNAGTDSEPTFDAGALLEAGTAGAKSAIDVGSRATLALTDWNNNGVRDLVMGARDGKIHVYLNEGTDAAPDFVSEMILQDAGGDLVVPSERSSPVVMDLTDDGRKDLLSGNTNGEIVLYSNQGTNDAPSFSTYGYVTAGGVSIDLPDSARSRPFVADWTGDGLPDLLVGGGDGKVHLFQGVPEPASLSLLATGGLGLLLLIFRRRLRLA